MASLLPPAMQNLKFDNSLGAMLIGALVSTALFGLTTLQTYLYFINYPNDRAGFKLLVGSLWVLDFAHSIFLSHSTYHFLVQQYGNPVSLLQGEWSIIAEVGITMPVTLLVQGFMAHRVFNLSHRNWFLAGVIVVLALTHSAIGFTCTARLVQIQLFSRLPEIQGIMSATLVIMAVNDLYTTTVLCWLLRKSQSSFTGTQSAIRLLIVYTIETGLLTSVFVTIDAICILTMPRNWIFIGITFCVSKLYANSLLTILNSRHSLQNKEVVSRKITSSGNTARTSHMLTSFRMQDVSHGEKDFELHSKPDIRDAPFDGTPRDTVRTGPPISIRVDSSRASLETSSV